MINNTNYKQFKDLQLRYELNRLMGVLTKLGALRSPGADESIFYEGESIRVRNELSAICDEMNLRGI